MRKILGTCFIVIGLMLLAIPAQALTVVNAYPGTIEEVQSVSELVSGPDMAGMQVTVTGNFSNTPVTGTWTTPVFILPAFDGGVFFSGATPSGVSYGFYIFQAGDTYTSPWMLYSFYDVTLYDITFNALPGNAVFDRTIDGMEKTPGSGLGKDCAGTVDTYGVGFSPFPPQAIYENQVALSGQSPQGDLYGTLTFEFVFGFGQTFQDSVYYELFTADTDRIVANVVPVPLVAPLGSSITLLGTGLLGIIGLRRKSWG